MISPPDIAKLITRLIDKSHVAPNADQKLTRYQLTERGVAALGNMEDTAMQLLRFSERIRMQEWYEKQGKELKTTFLLRVIDGGIDD